MGILARGSSLALADSQLQLGEEGYRGQRSQGKVPKEPGSAFTSQGQGKRYVTFYFTCRPFFGSAFAGKRCCCDATSAISAL